ncbi:MAG TPA: ABC transporter permease [Dehalococcoidia bacterium]|nr:ABC transporter permease [Dehalococcoidia bacterium]
MDGLAAYIVRRLLFLPVALLVVSFATFCITRYGPGDPISVYSGQYRDPEAFDRVRHKYGLDKPVVEQYGIWLKDAVLHGDLGPSFRYRDRTIPEIIGPKIWVSVRLGVYAFILTFLIGIPAGILAAVRQGTWLDPLVIGFFLIFQSIPILVTLPLLVLGLSVKLDLVPPGGFDGIFTRSMIIPTIALGLPGIAGVARLARAVTLGTLHEDFVRTARAKGLDEGTVVVRHVARNSVVPVMTTVIGLSIVGLLEGALFTETILGIPGIGRFIFESVNGRDYNVILAIVLLMTVAFMLANLVVDIVLAVLDPRLRTSGTGAR